MAATFVATVLACFAAMVFAAAAGMAGVARLPARSLVLVAAGCCVLAALGAWSMAHAQSGAHGAGHAGQHDQYKTWRQPGTSASCCNAQTPDGHGDCRPTRAYMGDDGLWRAWDGSRWLTIPKDKLLPTDHAGDGRNHLCEINGTIYCFTPAGVRG